MSVLPFSSRFSSQLSCAVLGFWFEITMHQAILEFPISFMHISDASTNPTSQSYTFFIILHISSFHTHFHSHLWQERHSWRDLPVSAHSPGSAFRCFSFQTRRTVSHSPCFQTRPSLWLWNAMGSNSRTSRPVQAWQIWQLPASLGKFLSRIEVVKFRVADFCREIVWVLKLNEEITRLHSQTLSVHLTRLCTPTNCILKKLSEFVIPAGRKHAVGASEWVIIFKMEGSRRMHCDLNCTSLHEQVLDSWLIKNHPLNIKFTSVLKMYTNDPPSLSWSIKHNISHCFSPKGAAVALNNWCQLDVNWSDGKSVGGCWMFSACFGTMIRYDHFVLEMSSNIFRVQRIVRKKHLLYKTKNKHNLAPERRAVFSHAADAVVSWWIPSSRRIVLTTTGPNRHFGSPFARKEQPKEVEVA